MKPFTLAAFAALLLGASALSANAADVYRRDGGLKDESTPEFRDVPSNNFKGLGVSVDIGGQFNSVNIDGQFDGISMDGIDAGLGLEYLFSAGRFRVGPYVEIGYSDVNTQIGGQDLFNQDWHYGGGIKGGVTVFGNSFLFAKLGYERENIGSDILSEDATVDAFVIGGGIETMLADHLSLGLGLDYLKANNVEYDGHDITDFLKESEGFRGKARLTYHLN